MDFTDLDLSGMDEMQESANEFDIVLNCVVVANLELTLKAIDRSEEEELAKFADGPTPENYELLRSITGQMQNFP